MRLKGVIKKGRMADPLAVRMLVAIISFSSIITLAATGVQLYSDYSRMVGSIHEVFDDVRNTRIETLSDSVWVLNDPVIDAHLDGIVRLNDIIGASVSVDGTVRWTAGQATGSNLLSEQFPLSHEHRGEDLRIGVLRVTASLEGVYARLFDRALMILGSNAVKTFLVAIFVFFLFRRLITRHLFEISEHSRNLDLTDADTAPLALDRRHERSNDPDVLDHLVDTFNAMRQRLRESYATLADSERQLGIANRRLEDRIADHEMTAKALQDSQETLELRVEERTHQLSQEITERKYVEKALKLGEERLRDIIEASSDWFWEMDETLRFTFVGGRSQANSSMQLEFILGQNVHECFRDRRPPDDPNWAFHDTCLAKREPYRDLELTFTISGPDMTTARVSGMPVFDESGTFRGYRGSATDISALKQAERRLRTFQRLVEATGQGLSFASTDGRIIFANRSLVNLVEAGSPDFVRGTSFFDFYTGDDLRRMSEEVIPIVRREGQWRGEMTLTTGSGRRITAIHDIFVVPDDQGGDPIIGAAITDISEQMAVAENLRRVTDAADKANRAKSEFLSSMSHELRTPLNAILGFGQILEMNRDGNLTDQQKEYLDLILKSGRHLLSLITDILDLSKIEAGKIDLSLEPVSVSEMLEECLPLVETMAADRGIRVEAQHHCDCCSPQFVTADYLRLKQAFLNLLSNAVKYNRDGGDILVCCGPVDGRFRVSVADTGYGSPPDLEDQLFTPFARLGAEATDTQGTGIGLALSKRLVELMGGEIGYESTPDEGTTFWLDLQIDPASSDENAVAISTSSTSDGTDRQASGGTILYVEDNPANLRLMDALLREIADLRMLSAHTAEIGFNLARVERPDIILIDINLPGMDGMELGRRLKADAATAAIPTIALSAGTTSRIIEAARRAGFAACLAKPADIEALMRLLEQHLGIGRNPAPVS